MQGHVKFRVQQLALDGEATFAAPQGCDSWPTHVQPLVLDGKAALVVVWRETPPPMPGLVPDAMPDPVPDAPLPKRGKPTKRSKPTKVRP